jgi:hypothetical protein
VRIPETEAVMESGESWVENAILLSGGRRCVVGFEILL